MTNSKHRANIDNTARKLAQKAWYLPPVNQGLFPRSKERGLIEARQSHCEPGNCRTFPRSKERGLIEAVLGPTQRGI